MYTCIHVYYIYIYIHAYYIVEPVYHIYIYIWSIHYMTIYAHHRPAAFFGFGFSSFQTFACGEVTPPLALRVHVFGAPAPLASWQVRLIPTRISGTVRTSTHIIAHHRTPSSVIIIQHHTSPNNLTRTSVVWWSAHTWTFVSSLLSRAVQVSGVRFRHQSTKCCKIEIEIAGRHSWSESASTIMQSFVGMRLHDGRMPPALNCILKEVK